MSGQLEIPGYSYDPIKKRYFKLTPAQLQESKRKVKAEAHEARSKRSKARKKAHQKQSASRENRNPLEQKLDEQKQGLEKRLEQRRFRSPAWQRPAELRLVRQPNAKSLYSRLLVQMPGRSCIGKIVCGRCFIAGWPVCRRDHHSLACGRP